MVWKMRLEVEDDSDEPRPSKWRTRLGVAFLVLVASLWFVAVTALAVWLASRIT